MAGRTEEDHEDTTEKLRLKYYLEEFCPLGAADTKGVHFTVPMRSPERYCIESLHTPRF